MFVSLKCIFKINFTPLFLFFKNVATRELEVSYQLAFVTLIIFLLYSTELEPTVGNTTTCISKSTQPKANSSSVLYRRNIMRVTNAS